MESPSKMRRRQQAEAEISAVNEALAKGFPAHTPRGSVRKSAVRAASESLNEDRLSFAGRVGFPDVPGLWKRMFGLEPNWALYIPEQPKPEPEPKEEEPSPFAIEHSPPQSYIEGYALELISRPDNTFLFGAAGDLHAASKYTRWDVRESLYKYFVEEGAQCNFDTGNWIDGEREFNRYDIEAHGLDSQCTLLSRNHPKGLPTYAVWGDDHEGWYVQKEGIDVGRYAESIMREAGHEWTNLGFMEAHIKLTNVNSGESSFMAVVHPGGGSAYALSYSIQKVLESLEGGEKPAVGLYGHFHKLWAGNIRNVWAAQTGTQQDQTPFMRKKRLEAHVGGVLVKLRQDPRTGAIISMQPEMIRYFNRGYYETSQSGRWSKHGQVNLPSRIADAS